MYGYRVSVTGTVVSCRGKMRRPIPTAAKPARNSLRFIPAGSNPKFLPTATSIPVFLKLFVRDQYYTGQIELCRKENQSSVENTSRLEVEERCLKVRESL